MQAPPQYPEGRNKYHRNVYNFNAALNRATGKKKPPTGRTHKNNKNRPPLPPVARRGPAIQIFQRDPFAPVYHIPRHAAKKNLYNAMTNNPEYAATIKERLFSTALPKINALRQTEEYQSLDPEQQSYAENLIKMQYVYLPTSYEANLNENIRASVASRQALGLPPATALVNAANALIAEHPNYVAAAATPKRLNNKATRRARRTARLAHIKETDPVRYERIIAARKRLAEASKARAAAQNSQEQLDE